MQRIALIEDDADLFTLLKYTLERDGYLFFGLMTGEGALEFCRRERPDLLILDIALPYCDGLEICRQLRDSPDLVALPIIFMTARASENDRIVGLELGGNDYLVKPFSIRELRARIRVQLQSASLGAGRLLRTDGLELDRARCEVYLRGKRLEVTVTEFRLLECLMSRPGLVLSRCQILNLIWGQGLAVPDPTIDVFILGLREKIEADPTNPVFIQSVPGLGYRFCQAPQTPRQPGSFTESNS